MKVEEIDGLIVIQQNQLENVNNQLYVNLNVNISKFQIMDNESLELILILADGDHQKELPCILVNGKNIEDYKKMVGRLVEKSMLIAYNIYRELKVRRRSNHIFSYSVQVRYEDWMEKNEIKIIRNFNGDHFRADARLIAC